MIARRQALLASAAAAVALGAGIPAFAADIKEINFGILSTESQATARPNWTPFLADMEKFTGLKVNAFFANDYAGVIEGMRFNKVQVAWYGNASAMQAADRANAEIFVQSTYKTGGDGYYSVLIVNKDSPLHSLEDVVHSPGKLTFGNGDPNSTSGFLIPSYYAWAKNNIDIKKHFTRVIGGNHESNMLAVSAKQVDVATGNTEDLERFEKNQPERFKEVRVIWKSPLIPSDPIAWRADLPQPEKDKLKAFFIDYGRPAPGKDAAEMERQVQVLKNLQWGLFKASSNKQLIPIREVALFRDRLKIENDDSMPAAEKQAKLREIDDKLAELKKQAGV
ncbi:MAG TPA: phosphonate ABC transporter substrate-binding protein [Alphaproteobacteria bacterium]